MKRRSARVFVFFILAGLGAVASADDCPPAGCDLFEKLWLGETDFSSAIVVSQDSYTGSPAGQCYRYPFDGQEFPECVNSGYPIGQSFLAPGSEITRIDLVMSGKGDKRPLSFKLWQWLDDGDCTFEEDEYDATTNGTADFADFIALPGNSPDQLVVLRPNLNGLTQGGECCAIGVPNEGGLCDSSPYRMYYMELVEDPDCTTWSCPDPGEWGLRRYSHESMDKYPDGAMRLYNSFRDGSDDRAIQDFMFRIYDNSGGPVTLPDLVASDSLDWDVIDPTPTAEVTYQDIEDLLWEAFSQPDANTSDPLYRALICASLYQLHGSSLQVPCPANLDTFFKGNTIAGSHFPYGESHDSTIVVDRKWMEHLGWSFIWGPIADVTAAKNALIDGATHFWRTREVGTHNRAIGGALTYFLVTRLVTPEDLVNANPLHQDAWCTNDTDHSAYPCPECDAADPAYDPALCSQNIFDMTERPLFASDYQVWMDYANEVWDEFAGPEGTWENQEDCAHYETLTTRYILELDRLGVSHTPIPWTDSRVVDYFERIYQQQTPLGPVAIFGDTKGLDLDWGTRVWILHHASRNTQDPLASQRYRQAAYRAWDYHARHAIGSGTGFQHQADTVTSDWISFVMLMLDLEASCAPTCDTVSPPPTPVPDLARVLDESQSGSSDVMKPAADSVAQRFRLDGAALAGLELKVKPKGSVLTFEIFEWDTDYGTATSVENLRYKETRNLTGAMQSVELDAFFSGPDQGEYLVRISGSGKFEVASAQGNPYSKGTAYRGGTEQSGDDLYFSAFSLANEGSVISRRWAVRPLKTTARSYPPRALETLTQPDPPIYPEATVWDKLVLRSGHDPDDLHVMVNLIQSPYGHGHDETGGVVHLSDNGSLILGGVARNDRHAKYNSAAIDLRHFTDGTPVERDLPVDLEVPLFEDSLSTTVAWLQWKNPYGWLIDHQRHIYFVKNRFLVIRDTSTVGEEMNATLGTVWRSYDLWEDYDQTGFTWAHLYNLRPRSRPTIGDFRNSARYVLVHQTGSSSSQAAFYRDDYPGEPPASAPFSVTQRQQGYFLPTGDVTARFDTVLLPHSADPTTTTGDLVESVPAGGENPVVEITVGEEIWIVVDNPDGAWISASTLGLTTDARFAIGRREGESVTYLRVHEATRFQWKDVDRTWGSRSSVEMNGFSGASIF